MAKYFDEEWPKEEEILRIGLEQSRRNKADRFPTADERWPRAGKIMRRRAFIIGNGESRKNFDLTTLKKHGKIYACNAYYRDNPLPDVLIAVDSTMTHEIYHKGIAHKIPCYFREWTKCPNFMYETMLQGMLHTQDKDKADKIVTNADKGNMFVMNAHTIKGEATIRKEDGTKYKKDVDNAHIYVSWITDGDKTQEWEDPGYHAGATAGHIACKYSELDEVYMIGMDLRSDTKMFNNIYKGTKNYSSAHYEPQPTGVWEAEWLRVLKDNPKVSFYKVNKADDNNTTNQKLLGNEKNLTYITQAQLLDNISKW